LKKIFLREIKFWLKYYFFLFFSWDSCGCESGIVLRDSAERDDASRNVDLLEAALGGGELVLDFDGKKQMGATFGDETAGTTPVQR